MNKGAETTIAGGVRAALAHDSAVKHVTGEAIYVDDIAEPPGTLHAALGLSARAHARIRSLDLAGVGAAPGVVAVIAAADVPGENNVGPILKDEPIFADGLVEFFGQPLYALAAETVEQARRAARLARVEYDDLHPVLDVEEALARKSFVVPSYRMRRGDARGAIAAAPLRLQRTLGIGGQEHFYLEGQVALAVPGEDGDMVVHSSTQHPSETQHLVAAALGVRSNAVTVEVRRMGGAFGGKETQAALPAIVAALLARRTRRPVKLRLDRDDDMTMTGKRHDFRISYDIGFDDDGRIRGAVFEQVARCGVSADLSSSVCDRAMFHADNAYYLEHALIESHRCKTNTVSNTAFRGFGGPQGMMGIEDAVDEIARALSLDPLDVRKRNLYGVSERNVTPYHMTIEDNILEDIIGDLEESSAYRERREAISDFNATSLVLKKGIALTPVKFGISYTNTPLNQGGALVHVYTDGSVHLNHGGTEMGQGLMTKVAQIVAEEFQIDVDVVKITATSTAKVPNTVATSASSGTDLNGAAAQIAARTIRERMAEVAAGRFGVAPQEVAFRGGRVFAGGQSISFAELAHACFWARVSLSATGYFRTPGIQWDRDKAQGRPFRYFAYGVAVSEVIIDTLTGESRLLRADVLHDVGSSINPAIDLGQVEGGFVQGMGWLTSEELVWDAGGRLMTHAPSTYKIPVIGDVPADFRVRLVEGGRNRQDVVYRSKAVGEPPLMLGISVFFAIKDAIASVADYRLSPRLDAPATPERILLAIEALRARRVEARAPAKAAE